MHKKIFRFRKFITCPRTPPTPPLFSVLKRKGRVYQEVEDTEPQHVKGDADVAMVVKPVPHLNTHAATPTIRLVSDWILMSCQTQGHLRIIKFCH